MTSSRGSTPFSELSSRTPTPGLAGSKKHIECVVKLLDKEVYRFTVERKCKAKVICDHVMNHLDLVERDFFGIYFADKEQRVFLDPLKAAMRQVPDKHQSHWYFHFGIKYYVPDPELLSHDLSKYLYCLQLQQDIKEKRVVLDPTSDVAYKLVSLVLQAELGDFASAEHTAGYTHQYMQFLFENENEIPGNADKMASDFHKQYHGLTPTQAEKEFIVLSMGLPRYGKHLFFAEEFMEDRPIELGAGYDGITVYYNKKLATNYPWKDINKLIYHGHRFKIRYHPADDSERWDIKSHKFQCPETKWAKAIWKEFVDQHTFFRLAIPGPPPLPIVLPQLDRDSKIRFSGRTMKQLLTHPQEPESTSIVRTYSKRHSPGDSSEWKQPQAATAMTPVHAGLFDPLVTMDMTKPVISSSTFSSQVAMMSFPHDDTPSPQLHYRIVIKKGQKTYQKSLTDVPASPPTPSYRLRWVYVRNAKLKEYTQTTTGIADLNSARSATGNKRPVNVVDLPASTSDEMLNHIDEDTNNFDKKRDFLTSTESLEDFVEKAFSRESQKAENHTHPIQSFDSEV